MQASEMDEPRAPIAPVALCPVRENLEPESCVEGGTWFSAGDREQARDPILLSTRHRTDALPGMPWVMRQRWNDLLFAHWPVPPSQVERLLPAGLTADIFDGSAWLGVVPFTMDQIQIRGLPVVPGANRFAELNLRTYVRERDTNQSGVYFFSLDATNPLAVAVARLRFHLPYYWARMRVTYGEGHGLNREVAYTSTRLLSRQARFRARYRSLGQAVEGPAEHFLTARYSLYTTDWSGQLLRGRIHHLPWPLERAEAEFELNELPQAFGLSLPDTPPLLHYSRELVVYIWSLERSGIRHQSLGAVPLPETLWRRTAYAAGGHFVAGIPGLRRKGGVPSDWPPNGTAPRPTLERTSLYTGAFSRARRHPCV